MMRVFQQLLYRTLYSVRANRGNTDQWELSVSNNSCHFLHPFPTAPPHPLPMSAPEAQHVETKEFTENAPSIVETRANVMVSVSVNVRRQKSPFLLGNTLRGEPTARTTFAFLQEPFELRYSIGLSCSRLENIDLSRFVGYFLAIISTPTEPLQHGSVAWCSGRYLQAWCPRFGDACNDWFGFAGDYRRRTST